MITLSDEELLEKATLLLRDYPVSGASIEFLEGVLLNGFADEASFEDEEDGDDDVIEARRQRRRIRELCILHQLL